MLITHQEQQWKKKYIYQCISVFLCFYTHTPLNGIRAGFPTEPSLVLKIKSLVLSFYLYKVQLELNLISQTGGRKEKKTFLSLLPMLHHLSSPPLLRNFSKLKALIKHDQLEISFVIFFQKEKPEQKAKQNTQCLTHPKNNSSV